MAATRKILVTGGAGFIGSALVKCLVADGHQVTVLDDMSRGNPERLAGVQCSIYRGDVTRTRAVLQASHGIDTIVHLAYLQGTQTFYSEPRQVLNVALRGMLNIMSACEENGIGDLLLVSSSEAYQVATEVPTPESVPCSVPNPLNPRYSYGGGKIACELMANAWQRAGVLDRAVIARPHNIIGPDMGREHVLPQFCIRMNDLVRDWADKAPIPFPIQGTGEETRSFCHIDSCVAQLALLLDKAPGPAQVWHVGMEDERTITDLAHEVAKCYGREIKVIPGSLPEGSPPRRCPSTAKIQALAAATGTRLPKAGFAEAVADTVAWYRRNG